VIREIVISSNENWIEFYNSEEGKYGKVTMIIFISSFDRLQKSTYLFFAKKKVQTCLPDEKVGNNSVLIPDRDE
jgi:hypothetical protein